MEMMPSHVTLPTLNVPTYFEAHLFLLSFSFFPLRCIQMLLVMCNPLQVSERVRLSAHELCFYAWLAVFFFQVCSRQARVCTLYSQQVLGVDGVNFSVHVENQTQVRDTMSRRHHRVYQLYSRTSGKHVQVMGRRISARGEDGDKYGKTHTHTHAHKIGCNRIARCICAHAQEQRL